MNVGADLLAPLAARGQVLVIYYELWAFAFEHGGHSSRLVTLAASGV
jgi:hypothetical protein